jgi:putative peptidoglycan lipid II flippase
VSDQERPERPEAGLSGEPIARHGDAIDTADAIDPVDPANPVDPFVIPASEGPGGGNANGLHADASGADAAAARGRSSARESGKLSLLTMASRILGLVREMTKASFLGTSSLAEAFTAAFTIPNLMRRLFAEGSVSVAFIPTFGTYVAAGDDRETRRFLSSMLTALVILVLAVVAIGIAVSPLLVGLFRCDLDEGTLLTRMMFPFLALVSVAAMLQGILNSIGVFGPSGWAPIAFNLCWIVIPPIVGPWMGNPARAMAVAVLGGGLMQALVQLPAVLKAGYRFGFSNPLRAFAHPGVRRVFALIGPTIVGMAAFQLNEIVSSTVGSQVASQAGATALSYSLRLQELVLGVFAVAIGTVLLPTLVALHAKGDRRGFYDRYESSLETIILITVPIAAFSLVAGGDIVELVYRSGLFDERSTEVVSSIFFWHMTGMPFIALNRVMAPAFYARGDTKRPSLAGIVSFALNAALAFALGYSVGIEGIAIGLSISSLVNTAILAWFLVRGDELAGRSLAKVGAYFAKIAAFSALAAVMLYFGKQFLQPIREAGGGKLLTVGLPLVLESVCFGAIGVTLLAVFRDRVAFDLVKAFLPKRKR